MMLSRGHGRAWVGRGQGIGAVQLCLEAVGEGVEEGVGAAEVDGAGDGGEGVELGDVAEADVFAEGGVEL